MKHNKYRSLSKVFLLVFSVFLLSGCKKEDNLKKELKKELQTLEKRLEEKINSQTSELNKLDCDKDRDICRGLCEKLGKQADRWKCFDGCESERNACLSRTKETQ